MTDEIVKEKIRRACLSGPPSVTGGYRCGDGRRWKDDRVAERHKSMGMLSGQRKHYWRCAHVSRSQGDAVAHGSSGEEAEANKPDSRPDLHAFRCHPKELHRPVDTTSPAIPIGPHWMIIWPFDAKDAGLGTIMRDAGAMVMFAGTPWAHLHICGSPWEGSEYQIGDRVIRTLTYARP